MSSMSTEIVWWQVDSGGGVYFRKTRDLEDTDGDLSAPKFSCWRAIEDEGDWIHCENGYWLPTQYMNKVEHSDIKDRKLRHDRNNLHIKLIKEIPTIIPYMKCQPKYKPYSYNEPGWVFHDYCKDWEKEWETSLYIIGLPKTNKITNLRYVFLKKSVDIFGILPLVCDIEVDRGGFSTGEAYLEFPENFDISEVIIKSDKFCFDKNHTLYVKECRPRPCKSYDLDLINWNYDGNLWFRTPNQEEIDERYNKEQEYETLYGGLCETPDPAWKNCEVTQEISNEYWAKMQASMDKFGYQDGENKGTIPTSLIKDDYEYELLQYSSHGFVCDEPMCQAMFQEADKKDGGFTGAFIYTRLPIYTCRGKDKVHEKLEDLCYVCLTK